MLTLKADKREGKEKNTDLRKKGIVPAIFYGPKEDSTPIKVSETDFMKVYDEAGESSIINLNDGSNEHEALIHDVQFDAISGRPVHVDFYVIEKGKKVEVHVPIEFVETSPAEKQLGGVLVKVMHELHIEALPKDLPANVEADLSVLVDFESQIKAGDIKLPEGVDLLAEADEIIALVQEHKEEEEQETAPDLDSIEVEEKGKKEEDSTEGNEGGEEKKEE